MATAAAEVTDERTESAEEETPDAPPPVRRRALRRIAGIAAFVLAAGALSGFGTHWYLKNQDAAADAHRRAAALDAARQEIVNLTSVDKNTAQQGIQRIVDGATGDFKDQFTQQAGSYRQLLTGSDVSSTGKVAEAGIVRIDENTAVVLAAATATVKNTDAPSGEQRVYRMRVTLQNEGNRWLVSKLEFVA